MGVILFTHLDGVGIPKQSSLLITAPMPYTFDFNAPRPHLRVLFRAITPRRPGRDAAILNTDSRSSASTSRGWLDLPFLSLFSCDAKMYTL